MELLQKEKDFFQYIAGEVRDYVSKNCDLISIAKHKKTGDFATQIDVAVEDLIIKEIEKRFPDDQILAEEKHSIANISKGRIWIIDPICGTNNLARGIKNYCTNIALAEDRQLIASCVIDHSQNDYFWSTGDSKVYVNDELLQHPTEKFDFVIDADLGSVFSLNKALKEKHNTFLKKIILQTNFYIISLNSSLTFAYTAVGKVDGFLNMANNPWDICAAAFLIKQSGGIITDLLGNPWTLKSVGMIAAKNNDIHQKLLKAFLSS